MLRLLNLGSVAASLYFLGDFRDFRLGARFDAVVCGFDSLNYLNEPSELTSVMKCVAAHLTSGGVFLFDVFDELFFQTCDDTHRIMQVGDQPIEMHFFYDKDTRRNDVRVVMGDQIERHIRVPIETSDVRVAANEAGLIVRDRFSAADYYYLERMTARHFYVLQKPT